jgi:hypothetical protein
MPRNRDSRSDASRDKLLRELDCAVIRYLHDSIERQIAADETKILRHNDSPLQGAGLTRGRLTDPRRCRMFVFGGPLLILDHTFPLFRDPAPPDIGASRRGA